MIFSFPDSSPEKMWHLYAILKARAQGPIYLSAAGGLSSTRGFKLTAPKPLEPCIVRRRVIGFKE